MQGRAGREPKNAAVGKVEAWEARLFRGGGGGREIRPGSKFDAAVGGLGGFFFLLAAS